MAVINIEKEMPESCGMCGHRTVCTVFGKGWANVNNRYSLGVHSRLDDCPLKSIDGLIKAVENRDDIWCYDDGLSAEHKRNEIVSLIKEYCGGEE